MIIAAIMLLSSGKPSTNILRFSVRRLATISYAAADAALRAHAEIIQRHPNSGIAQRTEVATAA